MRFIFLTLGFLLSLSVVKVSLAETLTSAISRLDANVIFMRHALAPGYGDPDHFQITDCSTQRNLDDTGRQQVRDIGTRLRQEDITFHSIYSSQWCRCRDTAQELGLGNWQEFSGLNSFFQGYADRKDTMEKLNAKLDHLPLDRLTLMVSHQVVIRAATGYSPASGGLVLYNTQTKEAMPFDFTSN
jgi:broad specificity phosphatase PhoE